MNQQDVETYWPEASKAQKIAIPIYHDAGYDIMPHIIDGMVEMKRDGLEVAEWLQIDENGNIRTI